jgi:hypothetical protein
VVFWARTWQTLTDEKNNDMKVRGKYNYKNASKWLKRLPGKDIFNLKKNIHSNQYRESTLDVHCDFHEGEANPVL